MIYDTPFVTPEVLLCSHVSPGKMTKSEYIIFMIFFKTNWYLSFSQKRANAKFQDNSIQQYGKGPWYFHHRNYTMYGHICTGSSYSENSTDRSMYIYSYIA